MLVFGYHFDSLPPIYLAEVTVVGETPIPSEGEANETDNSHSILHM